MFTVNTMSGGRVVVGVVVTLGVVVVCVVVVVRGVVVFITLHSGETGLPVSLLQLMYKLELSEVVMALMALIAIWLLTIFTMVELYERSKNMQLVMERVSDLETEILSSGK